MLIKICGITTIEAAQVASEAGADFLGLMFYPPSPRYLSPSATDDLVAAIKRLARRPKLVGLFVNLPLPEIAAAVARYDLDYIQLHGEENPPLCQEAARLRPVIRALRLPLQIEPAAALRLAAPFGQLDGLTLLLDTHKSGMYGGTAGRRLGGGAGGSAGFPGFAGGRSNRRKRRGGYCPGATLGGGREQWSRETGRPRPKRYG